MVIKYASSVLIATILAAAVGVSAVEPEKAEAAGTVIAVETCTGGTINLSTTEKQVLDLHNKTRADNGLPKFCVHPALTRAARAHSQDMLDRDYAAHTSLDGETIKARLIRFGYTFSGYSYWTYGENIAWGSGSYATPDSRFKFWMNSPPHKGNILNKNRLEIGIGARTGAYKTKPQCTPWTSGRGVNQKRTARKPLHNPNDKLSPPLQKAPCAGAAQGAFTDASTSRFP